jgi:hypothetical protein
MTPSDEDFGSLVAEYQVLCIAISYWEPINWHHPALQQWLAVNGFGDCSNPWQLPPAALWVIVASLRAKLAQLQGRGRGAAPAAPAAPAALPHF